MVDVGTLGKPYRVNPIDNTPIGTSITPAELETPASRRSLKTDVAHGAVALGSLALLGAYLPYNYGAWAAEGPIGVFSRALPKAFIETSQASFNTRFEAYMTVRSDTVSSFEQSSEDFARAPASSTIAPLVASAATGALAGTSAYLAGCDSYIADKASYIPFLAGFAITQTAGNTAVKKATDASFDYVVKPLADVGISAATAVGADKALENSTCSKAAFIGTQLLRSATGALVNPDMFVAGALTAAGIFTLRGIQSAWSTGISSLLDKQTYFNPEASEQKGGLFVAESLTTGYVLNGIASISYLSTGAPTPKAVKEWTTFTAQNQSKGGLLTAKIAADIAQPLLTAAASHAIATSSFGSTNKAAQYSVRGCDMVTGSKAYERGFESISQLVYLITDPGKKAGSSEDSEGTGLARRVANFTSKHAVLTAAAGTVAVAGVGAFMAPDLTMDIVTGVSDTVTSLASSAAEKLAISSMLTAADKGLRHWIHPVDKPAEGLLANLGRNFGHYSGYGTETFTDGEWLPRNFYERSISPISEPGAWWSAIKRSLPGQA